jgi:putative membrane protein
MSLFFAILASLIHVYIFVLESLLWTTPKVRALFSTSKTQAELSKSLAFNQGFYNLFLAIAGITGVGLVIAGSNTIGLTLIVSAASSMVLAASVLGLSDNTKIRSAIVQALFPVLALAFLLIYSVNLR